MKRRTRKIIFVTAMFATAITLFATAGRHHHFAYHHGCGEHKCPSHHLNAEKQPLHNETSSDQ